MEFKADFFSEEEESVKLMQNVILWLMGTTPILHVMAQKWHGRC